jgi:hypothetical protein
MKSLAGQFELITPRDSAGTFVPQIAKNTKPIKPMSWNTRLSRYLPCVTAIRIFEHILRRRMTSHSQTARKSSN